MFRFALFAAAFASAAVAQEDVTPTFRTSVSLVKVDTKVTARDGSSISDLSKEDFIVFDEDSQRPIVEFDRQSETQPLRLVLLLDVSGSMSRLLGDMSAKASEALRQLHPGDQVAVMVFATKTDIVLPFTTDLKQVPEKIVMNVFKTTSGRDTYTNEAIMAASGYLKDQRGPGRKAILVVTDNEGAHSAAKDAQVLRSLHEADSVLNAILVGANKKMRGTPGPYSDPASGPPDVYRFVQNTGGDVIADDDPANALRRIVRQIATRYNFQYSAPQAEPGAFRRIRVDLSPAAQRKYPGAVVQARTGYYVDKE
jgi:Ca-activated chloride channel family protein